MQLDIVIGDNQAAQLLFRQGKIELTDTDLLYAGDREVTRIVQRTAQGLDYRGQPFAPYSTKGPYYYYPVGMTGTKGERRAVAARLAGRLGGETKLSKSGLGMRFASYAAFKSSLGRMNPDLTGPRAPHMMQALMAVVRNGTLWIGIWGAEAARAEGHNEGIPGRLPQRRFLDVSEEDGRMLAQDAADMLALRLEKQSNWTL